MTRDEFTNWLVDPVTQWVFAAVEKAAAQEKAEWERISWGNGAANQRVLDQLRDRASALSELTENDYETWCDWNGEPHEE